MWYLLWVAYQGWLLSSLLEDSGSQVVQNVGYGTHHASPSQAAAWGCHHQTGVLPPATHTESHHMTIHQLYDHHTSHPKIQQSYLPHHYCWQFQYGISKTLHLQKRIPVQCVSINTQYIHSSHSFSFIMYSWLENLPGVVSNISFDTLYHNDCSHSIMILTENHSRRISK